MADSWTYEWSEAKGAFAVSRNGEVITYTTTKEAAEEYIGVSPSKTASRKTPEAKEAPNGE